MTKRRKGIYPEYTPPVKAKKRTYGAVPPVNIYKDEEIRDQGKFDVVKTGQVNTSTARKYFSESSDDDDESFAKFKEQAVKKMQMKVNGGTKLLIQLMCMSRHVYMYVYICIYIYI